VHVILTVLDDREDGVEWANDYFSAINTDPANWIDALRLSLVFAKDGLTKKQLKLYKGLEGGLLVARFYLLGKVDHKAGHSSANVRLQRPPAPPEPRS
jgi:hypothetical protein